jgi:hypothetical protein
MDVRPTRAAVPRPDDEDQPPATLDRRRALAAFDLGALAAIGLAVVYGVLWTVFQLELGLIAVAVMGGWVIGGAVSRGAWQGENHLPDLRLRLLAALLGASAWLGAAAFGYIAGQIFLPQSAQPLLDRLSFAGFAEYIAGVYNLVHGIALATLAFFSWRSAR